MDERPEKEETQVPVSRLAITSFVLAILMFVLLFLPAPLTGGWALLFSPICGILAIGYGIAGLIAVERSGGRLKGRKQAITGIVLPVLALCVLILLLMPTIQRERTVALRMSCGSNLSKLGKTMSMYANDYQGKYPCAGGKGTRWAGFIPDWTAKDRNQAFGLDPNGQGGQATVGSSLYLLIRYSECPPQMFVCNSDEGTRLFKPEGYRRSQGKRLTDLWDFGPEPWRHYSYAYHWPYGDFALKIRSKAEIAVARAKASSTHDYTDVVPYEAGIAGLAVAADRSPWIASPNYKANDFTKFKPDMNFRPYINAWKGTAQEARYGNSPNNRMDGQNVLFIDGHVDFEKRPFVGIDNDNIYTRWDVTDKIRGLPPDMTSQPADKKDSLLVHDPPAKPRSGIQ